MTEASPSTSIVQLPGTGPLSRAEMETITRIGLEVSRASLSLLGTRTSDPSLMCLRAVAGDVPEQYEDVVYPTAQSLSGNALLQQQPIRTRDASNDLGTFRPLARALGLRETVGVPIVRSDEQVAFLMLGRHDPGITLHLRAVIAELQALPRSPTPHQHPQASTSPESYRLLSLLTQREVQILKHLARGMTNAQIADCLRVSEKSIRNQLSSIYARLEVANRLEAALWVRSMYAQDP